MSRIRIGSGQTSVVCLVVALLTACATPVTQRAAVDRAALSEEERTQQKLAVASMTRFEMRLWTVGYGVLKGAADQCGDKVRPSLGFAALSKDRIPENVREIVVEALELSETPRVLAVYKDSAAEAAGMQVGDLFGDAETRALPPVGTSEETKEAAMRRLSEPVDLTVLRDGQPIELTLTPELVCDYPLKLTPGNEVNAFADGKIIAVSRGMMRFAAEDRELALVIGHELGHNVMGHLTKRKQNMAFGAIFDILAAAYGINTSNLFMNIGGSAYSQGFESEADYVGLYYLARAGYDTEGAADFWRRMATEYPANIRGNHVASHPATTERFLALEQVHGEIIGKRDAGLELTPNRLR